MDVNKLNQDRLTDNDFCDFTIKTKTRDFPIHKCVFGVTSPFFKRIFLTNMKEKYESCVIIETISAETMETLIEFLYNQQPSIDCDKAFEIVEAADYLLIPDLVKHCQNILEDNLCEETALKIWKLANKLIIEDLLEKSSKIIKENFVSISKQNEFFESELNVVEEILKLRNELISEEEFYQCIEDWVRFDTENRQIQFSKLFLLIDLENISSEFLSENISNNSLVLENIESSKHLVKFMDQKIMKCITAIKESTSKRPDDSQKFVSFKEMEFVAVGGTLSPKSVRKYNVVTKQWTKSFLETKNMNIFAGLVLLNCELFVIGGRYSNSENSYSDVHCYNLLVDSPRKCSFMFKKRHKFGCAVLNSKIYVAGGMAHKTERLSSFEYYTPSLDTWKYGPDMSCKRAGCCLVSLNGWFYALGGTQNSIKYLNSMERLCMEFCVVGPWEIKASMSYPRTEFAAVVLRGFIYVIGGRNSQGNLSSVEKYYFYDDSWSSVASLNLARADHNAGVLGGKIYVVGGDSNGRPVTQIEVYDPELDEWMICDGDTGNLIGATIIFL